VREPPQIAESWNAEYRRGRYADDPPVPFVSEILVTLRRHPEVWARSGLYVGCGNGRNFLPLVDGGARLHGLDISEEAIARLRQRRPDHPFPLAVGDFRTEAGDTAFGYVVAIQVFQHGTERDAAQYFDRTVEILPAGGLFCLRVNAASTEINNRHTVLERNRFGGFTVRYDEGPKCGLPVHFYSREELIALTEHNFEPVLGPREDITRRVPPKNGSWAQWEVIWRRIG